MNVCLLRLGINRVGYQIGTKLTVKVLMVSSVWWLLQTDCIGAQFTAGFIAGHKSGLNEGRRLSFDIQEIRFQKAKVGQTPLLLEQAITRPVCPSRLLLWRYPSLSPTAPGAIPAIGVTVSQSIQIGWKSFWPQRISRLYSNLLIRARSDG